MLKHGEVVRLNTRVRRVVAPNPGPMTGAGTNTYLLGEEKIAVLDPGPAIPEHIDAILAAGDGNIHWVVCTHTHPDHSPAWRAVAEATGAEVLGSIAVNDPHQDETFQPTQELAHDQLLRTPEFTLRALHTPGHVSNHYCFLLEEEGMLFAGDHIMNGSTVVIVPPGGDMKAYIDSLKMLLDHPLKSIAPGHGEVIDDPVATVEWLVAHRLKRERKVLAGLAELGERVPLEQLVKVVYDDVDVSLHEWAKLSLTAHLIKLAQEQQVSHLEATDSWQLSSKA